MAEPTGSRHMGPCPRPDSRGNQPSDSRVVVPMARNNTSDAQHATHLRECALASAQIIQFAPYLARKREQEVERLLARLTHHSRIVEGDIRAWVSAMIEQGARY